MLRRGHQRHLRRAPATTTYLTGAAMLAGLLSIAGCQMFRTPVSVYVAPTLRGPLLASNGVVDMNDLLDDVPLHTDGAYIKDAQGRVVILRGINLSGDAKVPPFMPLTSEHLLDPLPEWGFNLVRLLFIWEAFEPTRGHYEQAYFDYYLQVIRWAHARGMYVLVDFHQDALSRYLIKGCGEGFPEWTIPRGIVHHTPDNNTGCGTWAAMQLVDSDERKAWQAFYRDDDGIQRAFINMAGYVARQLVHEPGVIGYDLFNEPLGDEPNELAPFQQALAEELNSAHPGALLFVEPTAVSVVGMQTGLPKPQFDNVVYAPHFYDGLSRVLGTYLGYSLQGAFATMRDKAQEWGVPLFVGEFGIPPFIGHAASYMRTVYDRLDDAFLSGAQWCYAPSWDRVNKDGWDLEDFSITDDHLTLRDNFSPRPYAQKVAGVPIRLEIAEGSEPADRSVELSWDHDPQAGSTELFIPETGFFAPGGPLLHVEGEDVICSLKARQLICSASVPGVKHLRLISR